MNFFYSYNDDIIKGNINELNGWYQICSLQTVRNSID